MAAGGLLAISCVAFAVSDTGPPAFAVTLIAAGAALRLAGELLQSASGWWMSFTALPYGRESLYQSIYSTAFSLTAIVAPLACAFVVTAPGVLGWSVLGFTFLVAGTVGGAAGCTLPD